MTTCFLSGQDGNIARPECTKLAPCPNMRMTHIGLGRGKKQAVSSSVYAKMKNISKNLPKTFSRM